MKLKLSADTQSLMIPKGNFFKDTNGKWIFVTENGKAVRKNISLGRENPLYYEVLSGLKEGEQVIVSDYSDYKKYEILDIKNNMKTQLNKYFLIAAFAGTQVLASRKYSLM